MRTNAAAGSLRVRLTAPLLMIISGASMYGGAAIGVLLFDYFPPAAVAWLRVAGSALVLLALVRPGRAAWTRQSMALAGAFGVITALMNVCFYEAINRLPLGTAVAIEFLGPIAVIAYEHRSYRGLLALLCALGGVILVADVHATSHVIGVLFALGAASLWAGYIILGKALSSRGKPLDSLAVGALIATGVTAPVLLTMLGHFHGPLPATRIALLVLALALASSVIPYGLDQWILRMAGRGRFALLTALLPASAVLIGLLALGQRPTPVELVGVALVVLAVSIQETTHERSKDKAEKWISDPKASTRSAPHPTLHLADPAATVCRPGR